MNVEINSWLNASQDKGNPKYVLDNLQDIIDYSNTTVDLEFIITINTDKLRQAGYTTVKVKPQQQTDIQFLISTDVKYFIIPETAVSIYSPADDKVINVSDTYTGINIQTANPFAIEANMYFYFS